MKSATFDAIKYIKGAEKVGFTREQAEYQANQANQFNEYIQDEIVTKSFLANELEKLQLKMIIKLGGMMVVQMGIIIAVLGFIIHK